MAVPRRVPKPLVSGSRIGVFAPAGTPDPDRLAAGLEVLRHAGFEVVAARNLSLRDGYLAGSDRERLDALEDLLDSGVEALLAARGGYGVMRVLPELPWQRIATWAGWLIGFSDLTALHAAAATRLPVATLHGPVATTIARDERSTAATLGFLWGQAPERLFRIRPADVVRSGVARGVAVGGNLSILAALVGTPYEPDWNDAVVFLEDVNEPLYRLDRLLTQLALSSRLASARAVVAGTFLRCGTGEPDRRARLRALLARAAPPGAVIVDGLEFGHGAANRPIPLGAVVEVDTARREIRWEATG